MKQPPGSMTPKLSGGDKTMPLSEDVRPLLVARAATDPNAARLLQMFKKADEIVSEHSKERIVAVPLPRLAPVPSGSYPRVPNAHFTNNRPHGPSLALLGDSSVKVDV